MNNINNNSNTPLKPLPIKIGINTTIETKGTVSAKVPVPILRVDVHVKNETSRDHLTDVVNNQTTVTVGKDQNGAFVETGTKGTQVGVKAEQKISGIGGTFIKFGGKLSVGNE